MTPTVSRKRTRVAGSNHVTQQRQRSIPGSSSNGDDKRKRVTLVIPIMTDKRLEMYCAVSERLKHEVTTEALDEYLSRRLPEIRQYLE